MKVFATRRIPEAGLDLLKKEGITVEVWSGPEDAAPFKHEVIAVARDCDVLLSSLTESVDREVLEAGGERLLGVANYAVGFDNIDIEAATELGIPVSNTPGVLTDTTADLTWALLTAIARNIVQADRYTREGRYRIWEPNLLLGFDISPGGSGQKKTLGIVGFGRIGQAVARRAKGFDMRILAHDPYNSGAIEEAEGVEYAEFEELLQASDFITLHTPLTKDTRHLISWKELTLMKPTAFLINTSRGPVVDERALVRALSEGVIAGAALDVYEDEPKLQPGLTDLENVIITPHIGSASRDTRDRMATMAAENAIAMLKGEKAPNVVNPQVYESGAYKRRTARLKRA